MGHHSIQYQPAQLGSRDSESIPCVVEQSHRKKVEGQWEKDLLLRSCFTGDAHRALLILFGWVGGGVLNVLTGPPIPQSTFICLFLHYFMCGTIITFIVIIIIWANNHAPVSPCVLLCTSFLLLFLSHLLLLPPCKWDEWTFLCSNAISSLCEPPCLLCVTYSGCWHSLFLGENTDAAFCFCSCFTSRLVLLILW